MSESGGWIASNTEYWQNQIKYVIINTDFMRYWQGVVSYIYACTPTERKPSREYREWRKENGLGVIIPAMIRDFDRLTSMTRSQSRMKSAKQDVASKSVNNRGTHGGSLHYYSISAKSQSIRLVKQEAPAYLGGGGCHSIIKLMTSFKMKKIYQSCRCQRAKKTR